MTLAHLDKALDLVNAPFSQEKHEQEMRNWEHFNKKMDDEFANMRQLKKDVPVKVSKNKRKRRGLKKDMREVIELARFDKGSVITKSACYWALGEFLMRLNTDNPLKNHTKGLINNEYTKRRT